MSKKEYENLDLISIKVHDQKLEMILKASARENKIHSGLFFMEYLALEHILSSEIHALSNASGTSLEIQTELRKRSRLRTELRSLERIRSNVEVTSEQSQPIAA